MESDGFKMVEQSKKTINPFYFICWIILVIGKGLNFSGESVQMQLLVIISIIIGFVGIIRNKYTKKELMIVVALIGLGVITTIFCKKVTILLSIVIICLGKNQNLNKLIKISFWIKLVLMCGTVILALNGELGTTTMYMTRYGVVYNRNGLGLGHANIAQMTLFICVIMFLYAYWEKINIVLLVLIILSDIYFYNYTFSRTGFLITLAIPFLVVLYKSTRFNFCKKILTRVLVYIYVWLPVFCFVVSLCYKVSGLSRKLNYLISSRFSAGYYYLLKYPFSLFGNYIDNDVYPLDNSYFYTYVAFGSIVLVMYLVFSTKLMKKFERENRYCEIVLLSVIALYSVAENSFTNITMNFTLLFFSELIYKPVGCERANLEVDNETRT